MRVRRHVDKRRRCGLEAPLAQLWRPRRKGERTELSSTTMKGKRPQLALVVPLPLGHLLYMLNEVMSPDQVWIDRAVATEGVIGGEGWTEPPYLFHQLFPEPRACPGCLREVVGSALGGMLLPVLMIMRSMTLLNLPSAPAGLGLTSHGSGGLSLPRLSFVASAAHAAGPLPAVVAAAADRCAFNARAGGGNAPPFRTLMLMMLVMIRLSLRVGAVAVAACATLRSLLRAA